MDHQYPKELVQWFLRS